MATLLTCSTFNCVRVWGGPNSVVSNTIVGCFAGQSIASNAAYNTIFGYKAACDFQDLFGNSVMGANALSSGNGATAGDVIANVVSDNENDNNKAKRKFEEILKDAKIQYDKFNSENDDEDEPGYDDDDDILKQLGL